MKTQKTLQSDRQSYKLEATLTNHVRQWLQIQTDIHFYKASDRFAKGVSDMILCVRGQFVGVELKKEGGITSPHQTLFIKQVIGAGGIAGVCYTIGDVKDLVAEARKRANEV